MKAISAATPAATHSFPIAIAACKIAPVEIPAKIPSTSNNSRTRLTESSAPTEKRRVITDAS